MRSVLFGVAVLLLAGLVHGDGDALYKQGAAVYKTDPAQAFGLFVQAAEAGNPSAMAGAGHCCETGTGTTVDYAKAIGWYEKAVAHNSLKACEGLARLYASCPDPEFHDGAKAIKYASAIARKRPHDPKTLTLLARAFMRGFDQKSAVDSGRKAFKCAGSVEQSKRMRILLEQYELGEPYPAIATEAWFRQAAEKNIPWAIVELVHMASNPEHALHNYAFALKICDQAIGNGDKSVNFLKGNILLETAENERDLGAVQDCYAIVAAEDFGTNKVYEVVGYRQWLTEGSAAQCFEQAGKLRSGYEVKLPKGIYPEADISGRPQVSDREYTMTMMPNPMAAEFLYKVARVKGHPEAATILNRMNQKREKPDTKALPKIELLKTPPLSELVPRETIPFQSPQHRR